MEITSLSQATRRFCDEHKIERFKPQDLRRTVATHMRRLGIDRFIVDRVQNRVDGSVQGQHYDVHDYLQEKTEALNTWADELERLRG